MPNAVIRADASSRIGNGHIYRCLSLAYGLQRANFDVNFLMRRQEGDLVDFIHNKGFKTLPLPEEPQSVAFNDDDYATWLGCSIEQDYEDCTRLLPTKPIELLIVDHYAIDAQWIEYMRQYAMQILIIDDLANRPLDCDYLLNQNLNFTAEDYQPLVSDNCNLLLGTHYALLRNEFSEYREKAHSRRMKFDRVGSILLFAEVIQNKDIQPIIEILNREQVKELMIVGESQPISNTSNHQLSIHQLGQVDDIERWMVQADLAIGGGGSATWERCCLGLPSAVLALADNQSHNAQGLDEARAGWFLTDTNFDEKLSHILHTLNHHPEVYTEYALNALKLCDGRGVERVCDSIGIT